MHVWPQMQRNSLIFFSTLAITLAQGGYSRCCLGSRIHFQRAGGA